MRNLTINQIKEEAEEVSKVSISIFEKIIEILTDSYNAFLEFVNPKGFLKKVVMLSLMLVFFNVNSSLPEGSTTFANNFTTVKTEEQIYVESVKEKMRGRLITEVGRYIEEQAPSSNLSPELFVDKCLEYDVDIIFVLSQGLLESHFGTKGVAVRTNSVWNVGAYDNQRPRNWYDTQDESLEPYLQLLTEDYLMHIVKRGEAVDTVHREIQELVEDRSYVNYAGKRFASARGYENAMRKLMVKIDMGTSISFYQDVMKMSEHKIIAYFRPSQEQMDSENFYALK